MTYSYYFVDTVANFDAKGIVRADYSLNLNGLGLKDISIVKNRFYGVIVDDVFLPVELNDRNGFNKFDRTGYIEDGNIFVGFNDES